MAKVKKRVKRNLFIFMIFLLILGIASFFALDYYQNNLENNNNENKNNKPIRGEDQIKTYKASLIATGDAIVHSPMLKSAYDSVSNTYDFKPMVQFTKEKVKGYDIVYYNQESVFGTKEMGYKGYPLFNTPTEFGDAMIDAGFNMVSISSNHSMDMGSSGVKSSMEYWKKHENILTNGMASSEEERTNYKINTINNIKYTMLSYTYDTNGLGKSELLKEPYLVNIFDEEKALQDIKQVRDKVDVLIVSMHWGNEYQQTASETQKKWAKFLADNGVDIILGTHSHCIEPFEKIGDTIVFYSLGNFISNQMGAEEALIRKVGTIGMFATLDITKRIDKKNNTTDIIIDNIGADLNFTYRYYNQEKRKNDYLVIPFSQMESKYLNNYENIYNEFSNVLKTYDQNINILPLPIIN